MNPEPVAPVRLDGRSLPIDTVVAIEALAAAQAYAIRGLEPAPALRPILAAIRARVPPMVEDREVGADIEAVEAVLRDLPAELFA